MPTTDDYVERTTEGPTTVRREEVHVVRGSNNAGWVIAAVVVVLAIVGAFAFMSQNSQSDLQAARDQGAAQAQVDNAASSAQTAANQAAQSAQTAVSSNAQATESAASAAADRAANVADKARDAAATAPAPATPQ